MDELRRFLEWLLPHHAELGGLTEIRILGRGTRSGVWAAMVGPEDLDDLVDALTPLSESPRERIPAGDHPRSGEANLYFSLQPVDPERRLHTGARFERVRRTTRDDDIHAYSLFVIDIDPEREPRDRSASEDEKAEARAVTKQVRAWLREQGVESLVADSGNGFHLLVPLVPADADEVPQAARDARTLLRWLDQRFSTPGAKVDTSTFNPSRILKLYGTWAVKGENTPEHPHRLARIDLSAVPEPVDLFARLQAVVAETGRLPEPPRPAPRPASGQPDWRTWRAEALAALPIPQVYGPWLTGRTSEGWLECRDPNADSGDRNPSAGVADGTGHAERAAFHSFRTGSTLSVFDFLVQRGRAVDFKAACALVAELSGVPLPSRRHPAVDRFVAAWPQCADQDARQALLHQTVGALLDLPAFKREPLLERVRKACGLSAKVFRATLAEVRRARREAQAQDAAPEGRAVVDYVVNRDTVEELFAALVRAVAPAQRFFRTERDVVCVRDGVGPEQVTPGNLAGLLSTVVELRFLRLTEDGESFVRYGVLPAELARAMAANHAVWEALPELRLYCRSPLFDRSWRFIGRPGFHAESGIYYDGPAVKPCSGSGRLERSLADFHWKSEADQVNFVGVLLTALTMPHWGRGHPFLAINGNKPGVGKTTLARVLGVLVEGADPNTVSYSHDDAEFEKQLATRVEAGDRVIVIDNAKTRRAIESAVLERCITDTRLSFRRLGSNTAITRPQNDILFCLTMNLTNLGTDLRRRALPVNLVLDEDVRKTRYGLADVIGYVEEHRLGIIGELAGMVGAWLEAGRPACEEPARHSTSQTWAATMDAILRRSGLEGFLSNFEASTHAFDPKYELMLEVALAHHGRRHGYAAEWVGPLEGLLVERFTDRRGQAKSARSKATIVGNLFREYVDVVFDLGERSVRLVRAFPEGEKRKPTYGFEVVP